LTKAISNIARDSIIPAIAIEENSLHLVWGDDTSGNDDIFYKRITSRGATTGPTINLNNNGTKQFRYSPTITVSGNIVHVVWLGISPANFDISYKWSLDDGTTFPNLI
jgi:hypothetical protein